MSSCGWFPLPPDEIAAWVEAHHDRLPTTLAELAQFPVAFRRVIVNAVSAEQRIRFWQAHLSTFLEPGAGLTAAQRTVIAEMIPQVSDLFGGPLLEAQSKMRPLEQRMNQTFSRAQCAAIIGMVGPPEPPGGLPLPPGTRLTPVE